MRKFMVLPMAGLLALGIAAPAAADSTKEEPAPRRGSAPRSRASGSAQVAAAAVDSDSEWQEF